MMQGTAQSSVITPSSLLIWQPLIFLVPAHNEEIAAQQLVGLSGDLFGEPEGCVV